MKTYKKVMIVIALISVMGGTFTAYRVQRNYDPMGGKVTIMDKTASGSKYYITIDEGTGDYFKLSCSQDEFHQVNIGDVVNCERKQSVLTYKGEVHTIASCS